MPKAVRHVLRNAAREVQDYPEAACQVQWVCMGVACFPYMPSEIAFYSVDQSVIDLFCRFPSLSYLLDESWCDPSFFSFFCPQTKPTSKAS